MVEDKPISYQESATEYNTLASSKMDPIYSGEHCEASSEYVTAIYSYMPQHSDEINLRTGQKIKVFVYGFKTLPNSWSLRIQLIHSLLN